MLASIKKWVIIPTGKSNAIACLRIVVEQAKLMVVYAILLTILQALNASPAN